MPRAGATFLRLGFVADPNSIHTRRWIDWFVRAGHGATLFDPTGSVVEPGLPPEVEVERLEPPSGPPVLGHVARRRALAVQIRRSDVQLLHAHYVRRYGWAAALSGFHPLVVTPWGSDLLQARRRSVRTRWWNRFALRAADLVTVSSEGMRQAAIRAGARSERIELVHHGVDTTRFSPGPRAPSGRRPRVLSIRAARPLYRHEVVVDAVSQLAHEGIRPELVMTRFGADAEYLEQVISRAHERGIGDQLVVLDAVSHDDLPDLYRSADAIVSVPETDSFSVTLLEAMACGLPAVVSDLPAVAPPYVAIDALLANLVVPLDDVSATAHAIRTILQMPDGDRARLGDRLRQFVVSTADYDTHMAHMADLYRGLVAG